MMEKSGTIRCCGHTWRVTLWSKTERTGGTHRFYYEYVPNTRTKWYGTCPRCGEKQLVEVEEDNY